MFEIIASIVVGLVVLAIIATVALAIWKKENPTQYQADAGKLIADATRLNPVLGAELAKWVNAGTITAAPPAGAAVPPLQPVVLAPPADANTAATAANTAAVSANTAATAALAAATAPPAGSTAGTAAGADLGHVLDRVNTIIQTVTTAPVLTDDFDNGIAPSVGGGYWGVTFGNRNPLFPRSQTSKSFPLPKGTYQVGGDGGLQQGQATLSLSGFPDFKMIGGEGNLVVPSDVTLTATITASAPCGETTLEFHEVKVA